MSRFVWTIALLVCSLLVALPSAIAQKRVALVVGINKYDNLDSRAQLKKAQSDAVAIAETLRVLGFEVIQQNDLKRSAFNDHWQDFLSRLTPGDTAIFYFAGHGIELAGQNYLLPRDTPNARPGREEFLRRESLSVQEFLSDLREKGTRLNLVILDACRENPFERVAGRSLGATRGLAMTEPPEGFFIMYSAASGESALDELSESDQNPNSVYTRMLLPLLRTPSLSLTDVAEQVRVGVRQLASTVQHRQTPAYYSQVLGRLCLGGGECSSAAATSAQPTEAERAWMDVRNTGSLPELQAFIQQFGGTYYGNLARERLSRLALAVGTRSVDLSHRLPPPEQQMHSSTTAWAVAYATAAYGNKFDGNDSKYDPANFPSPAYIYNKIYARNRDCKSAGSSIHQALELLKKVGAPPRANYPDSKTCSDFEEPPPSIRRIKIKDYQLLYENAMSRDGVGVEFKLPAVDLRLVKKKLDEGHPLIYSMNVGLRLTQLSGSEIYRTTDLRADGDRGGHVLVIVGYDESKGAFRVLNSWSTRWADGGYGWISYDAFLEMMRMLYVITPFQPPLQAPTKKPGPN
jgi:uncharacterized caspase-like protein